MTVDEIVIGLVSLLIGIFLTMIVVNHSWEHHGTIIKQGYGQYNKTTGDFEWIKKREEIKE